MILLFRIPAKFFQIFAVVRKYQGSGQKYVLKHFARFFFFYTNALQSNLYSLILLGLIVTNFYMVYYTATRVVVRGRAKGRKNLDSI